LRKNSISVVCVRQFRGRNQSRKGVVVSEVLDSFQIEWHGNTVVVTPASSVESLNWDLVEQAADLVMEPLSNQEAPMVVVDLSRVGYFGSVFLALLLRCHKFVKKKGGELVLCGASDMALELLRITALDTIWAIYKTRDEAMQALSE
jgi:anti-sigma B factor antagonist